MSRPHILLLGFGLIAIAAFSIIAIEWRLKRVLPKPIESPKDIPQRYKVPMCATMLTGFAGLVCLVIALKP